MQFMQSFLLVVSAILLLYLAQYSFTHRKTPGAFPFFIMIVATFVWTGGSLMELYTPTLEGKILWRNIQQLGVFTLPISSVYFAIDYTRNTKYLRYAYIASIPPLLSVLLIFTNELHHWMRLGYSLVASPVFGNTLVVQITALDSILVAYNFLPPLATVIILLRFARKISPRFRKQVYMFVFCFLYTFIIAWLRTAFFDQLGLYVEISVLNLPSALVMFINIFKHNSFDLAPVARDKVFEVINQGILVMDDTGTIIDANAYALSVMNESFQISDPLGLKLKDINKQCDELNQLIGHENEEQREIVISTETEEIDLSVEYYPLFHKRSRPIGSVMILNNITVQKHYERSLTDKAEHDFLTRFYNKFGLENILQQYLQDGHLRQYSILMIDIDNFKTINDTYGHAAGDQVLRHYTTIVNHIIRAEDIAGRLGGDEFILVIPNIFSDTALQIAERIRTTVEADAVTLNEYTIPYTVSIGIADNHRADQTFENILENADRALYLAKSKSRNCSIVYTEQMNNRRP